MNLMQLAKLMTAGVLAMAAVPAISVAHTHRPVRAAASSLTATGHKKTTTMKVKHTSLVSSKRHRSSKVKPLVSHRKTHAALTHRTHRATKLTTKKKAHAI